MSEKVGHGRKADSRKTMEFIVLLIALLMLFFLDKSSLVDILKYIIVFVLSIRIMKDCFPQIAGTISTTWKGNIYEFITTMIFSIFILIVIDFLFNKMYLYTLCAFACLLLFTIGVVYLIPKRENNKVTESKSCCHNN